MVTPRRQRKMPNIGSDRLPPSSLRGSQDLKWGLCSWGWAWKHSKVRLESDQKKDIPPETHELGVWVGVRGSGLLCCVDKLSTQVFASCVQFSDPWLLRRAWRGGWHAKAWFLGPVLPIRVPGQWWVPPGAKALLFLLRPGGKWTNQRCCWAGVFHLAVSYPLKRGAGRRPQGVLWISAALLKKWAGGALKEQRR